MNPGRDGDDDDESDIYDGGTELGRQIRVQNLADDTRRQYANKMKKIKDVLNTHNAFCIYDSNENVISIVNPNVLEGLLYNFMIKRGDQGIAIVPEKKMSF